MRTTSRGLYVWDQPTDSFSHSQLAANWDTVDALLGAAATGVELVATVPATNLTNGRLLMLSAASGGFAAYTLLRYETTTGWRPVGYEILPATPTSGNFAGRLVILSAADVGNGFAAWSVIRYDGAVWSVVGGFSSVNTGGAALNIQGLQTSGDIYVGLGTRGLVLVDRASGQKKRLYMNNNQLFFETVT